MFNISLFNKKDKNDKLNQMKSLGRRRKIHRVRCLNKLKRESESKFAVDRRQTGRVEDQHGKEREDERILGTLYFKQTVGNS